jgi:hypothetical protein
MGFSHLVAPRKNGFLALVGNFIIKFLTIIALT